MTTSGGHGVLLRYLGPTPLCLVPYFPTENVAGPERESVSNPAAPGGGGEAAVPLAFRFLPPSFASLTQSFKVDFFLSFFF